MKIAINYSPEAAELLREGKIGLDLFKCPSPFDQVVQEDAPTLIADAQSLLPIYLHFPLRTSEGGLQEDRWPEIDRVMAETGTPYVNLHLEARRSDFLDLSDSPEGDAQVIDRLIVNVERAANRFGADRVIVENVVYRGPVGEILPACVYPEAISQVVRETGCGLLLDTAHVTLSCHFLGLDPSEYIEQLPMDRVREIHVTGVQHADNQWRDSMPMRDEDRRLVHWVFQRIHAGDWPAPWVVALEYGGVGPKFAWRSDPAAIAEQVVRLQEMASKPSATKR